MKQEQELKDTLSKMQEKFDAQLQEHINYMHRNTALQMIELCHQNYLGENIDTMEAFEALETKSGDIVICKDDNGEPELAWILFNDKGKCQLIGSTETEDIAWFFNFGSIDIMRP